LTPGGGRAPEQVALIGFGAIGRTVFRGLAESGAAYVAAVLVRPNHTAEAHAELDGVTRVATSCGELFELELDLVAECAGHEAVRQYGEEIVSHGIDFLVVATGAFADTGLLDRLTDVADSSGARLLIPAGAIAGIDGVTALRRAGLTSLLYASAKPPRAWRGTLAEHAVDLDSLTERTAFFRGSARDAARLYPQNANLAATVALAGLGFDDTEIELVADPALTENVGRIRAEGRLGWLDLELGGAAMPDNPKTSAITAYSVLQAIENRASTIVL
jgi:aspartate dehydrogenase